MLNLRKLKKDEIIWMFEHKCKHGHNFLEHPKCYENEKPSSSPINEKIGYLDIETTGLNANWDYIISYAILENDSGKIYGRVAKRNETLNADVLDKNLMKEFVLDIRKFDKVIVYWGKDRRHDIPFLRTRALKWKENFPMYGEVKLLDAYDIVRNKLSLHRRRLENIATFLKIPSKGHRLDSEMWQKAKLGNEKALDYVWLHNKEDVITLKEVWEIVEKFTASRKTSI